MDSRKDIVIVGGGIIGLACAHYLLKENASVRIIEKDVIGSGASHGNCGLLHYSGILPLCGPGVVRHEIYRALCGTSPLYIKPGLDLGRFLWLMKFASHCNPSHMEAATRAKHDLLRYSKSLYDEFFRETPLPCDFEKKGLLSLFRDKKYFEKYSAVNEQLIRYGFGARPMDAKTARDLEPAIREDVVGAFYNEHDDHLRPEMLIQSWKRHLVRQGLIIEEKMPGREFRNRTESDPVRSDGKGPVPGRCLYSFNRGLYTGIEPAVGPFHSHTAGQGVQHYHGKAETLLQHSLPSL